MAATLTLFCLVSGEPASSAFPVEVSSDKTIGQLKDAIVAKKPNAFEHIDANDLALWRVTVPVDDDDEDPPILLDTLSEKKKLHPTDDLPDVFKETPLKKAIHILIERPKATSTPQALEMETSIAKLLEENEDLCGGKSADTLLPVVASLRKQLSDMTQLYAEPKNTSISLGIVEKRGGEKVCTYTTDIKLATVEQLRTLLHQHFEQLNGDDYVQIFVYQPGHSNPVRLADDTVLRSCLEQAKENGLKNLTISLDSPAKSFSKYTWNEVVGQYGIWDTPGLMPLFDIQARSMSEDEREVLEHIVKDCTFKKNAYVFDKLASELTRSSIVDTFMVGAMNFHKSNMFLAQQRHMSGMRGHGPVDFAVVDRIHQTQVLGVTEVKTSEEFVQGLAQNIVQLDVAVQQKKRKRTEDDDGAGERQPVRFRSYGIVTDSYNWTLLECTLDEVDALTYRAKEIPVGFDKDMRKGGNDLRDSCEIIFGYVLALFDLMKDEIVIFNG